MLNWHFDNPVVNKQVTEGERKKVQFSQKATSIGGFINHHQEPKPSQAKRDSRCQKLFPSFEPSWLDCFRCTSQIRRGQADQNNASYKTVMLVQYAISCTLLSEVLRGTDRRDRWLDELNDDF